MDNDAGQVRDESRTLNCPRCNAAMEQIAFGGTTVDRCVACKSLWFDALEKEKLKDVDGSESIDTGSPSESAGKGTSKLSCPVCKTPMIVMTDHQQPNLKFESCKVCYGTFFEPGEFRDYKDVTLVESIRRLFR